MNNTKEELMAMAAELAKDIADLKTVPLREESEESDNPHDLGANPLFDPDNWVLVFAEDRDEQLWAYAGPEAQPWMLRGADPLQKQTSDPAEESEV